MQNSLKVEQIRLTNIQPFKRNAKLHPKEQVAQIVKSIKEFGFNDPIAISETGEIIEGHGRFLAVKELGYSEVPCIRLTHLSEEQRRAYILAHNRLTMNSGFDTDMLLGEFDFLKGAGFDVELTGFDLKDIEKMFDDASPKEVKEDDFDMTAALEQAAFVVRGDVWRLGRHRLLCGDATDGADMTRLMDGKRANLVLTDIPYGVNFKSASGLSIMNDNLKGEEFYKFLLASFGNMCAALDDEGSIYVFHADSEGLVTRRAFDDAGLQLHGCCVWVKNAPVLGHADYQYAHESILYGWKKSKKHKFYGDRKNTTIWNFDKPKKNKEHPNQKPVELMAHPIKNSTQSNGIVLDSFLGSGSTLIACEQTDRTAYGLELDPKYASVILRRYAEFKQNGGADITCERGGETLRYVDLVKAMATKK